MFSLHNKGDIMTKTVSVTNLTEIKGVKISCKCGAQWVVPVGDIIPPKTCFSCGKEMQWQAINRATKGIAAINEASKHSEFIAEIETDIKNN
jgi:hypothetical protein